MPPLNSAVRRPVNASATNLRMTFQTSRLLIRDLQSGDEGWLGAFFSEPEARQNILRRQRALGHGSRIAALSAKYLDLVPFYSRTYLGFAVLLRDSLEPIGFCGLSFVAEGSNRTYLGWHFSEKFRNHGYATEAGREIIRVAFEERHVTRVISDCYQSNTAGDARTCENRHAPSVLALMAQVLSGPQVPGAKAYCQI